MPQCMNFREYDFLYLYVYKLQLHSCEKSERFNLVDNIDI